MIPVTNRKVLHPFEQAPPTSPISICYFLFFLNNDLHESVTLETHDIMDFFRKEQRKEAFFKLLNNAWLSSPINQEVTIN